MAYRAIVRGSGNAALRDLPLTFLLSRQQPGGSWKGEAFSTALALQALADSARAPLGSHIESVDVSRVIPGGNEPTMTFAARENGLIRVVADDPLLEFLVSVTCGGGVSLTTMMSGGDLGGDDTGLGPRWYAGGLDEVAYYDRALGADRIRAHYDAAIASRWGGDSASW